MPSHSPSKKRKARVSERGRDERQESPSGNRISAGPCCLRSPGKGLRCLKEILNGQLTRVILQLPLRTEFYQQVSGNRSPAEASRKKEVALSANNLYLDKILRTDKPTNPKGLLRVRRMR